MTVMNNPFINYLDIRFAKLPRGKINIRLTDVAGRRIVAQEFDVNYQSVIRLNVGNKGIKSGIYILTVDVNGEKYSTSVMRK